MKNLHNAGRALLISIIVGSVVLILALIVFFLFFYGEKEDIATLEKKDVAEIINPNDPRARDRDSLILRELPVTDDDVVRDDDVIRRAYTTLGLNPGATRGEIDSAYRDLVALYGPQGAASDPVRFRGITGAYNALIDNAYTTLGLNPGATRGEIDSAYRDLVALYGPQGAASDPVRFRGITGAYNALIDNAYTTLGLNPGATRGEIDSAYRDLVALYGPQGPASDPVRFRGITGAYNTVIRPFGDVSQNPGSVLYLGSGNNPFVTPRRPSFPGITPPTVRPTPFITPPAINIDIPPGPTIPSGPITPPDPNDPDPPPPLIPQGPPGTVVIPEGEFEDEDFDLGSILQSLALAVVGNTAACIAGTLLTTLLPHAVNDIDGSDTLKDCGIDVIAYGVAKQAALDLASSYIDWALTGFHGQPYFIDNPSQFWKDFADRSVGRALESGGLGFLCDIDGIKIDISSLLQLRYRRIGLEPPRCTLSDFINNIDDFIDNPVDFVGNPIDFIEDDPIILGSEAAFYSATVDFALASGSGGGNAVTNNAVVGVWEVTITEQLDDGTETSQVKRVNIRSNTDTKGTIHGRTKKNARVHIVARKGPYVIEQQAFVGSNQLDPALRGRRGVRPGNGAITINPFDLAGVSQIDANEKLDRVSDTITREIRSIVEDGNELTQLSEQDRLQREILERSIGEEPSQRELLSSGEDPTAIASYTEECHDDDGAEIVCPVSVKSGATTIARRKESFIDLQIQSVHDADGLGEIIQAVVDATVVGLVKRVLKEGLSSSWISSRTEIHRVSEGIPTYSRGGNWWVDTLLTSSTAGSYINILSAEIRIRDSIKLLSYINTNLHTENTPPIEYRQPGEDGVYYKTYSGGFRAADYPFLEAYPNGNTITNVLRAIQRPRTLTFCDYYNDAGGCGYRRRRNVTAYIYPDDRAALNGATTRMKNSLESDSAETARLLREIYEATMAAYIQLVGEEEEYRGDSTSVAKQNYRNAILQDERFSSRLARGVSKWAVVRDATIENLRNRSVHIYTAGSEHINLLRGACAVEVHSGDGGVISGRYVEMDCTLDEFTNFVNTSVRNLPKSPEKIIYALYVFGHESKLVRLPTASAQTLLTSFSTDISSYGQRQRDSEKYRRFGEIFVGEGDPQSSTEHWGALSATEAERRYRDSFQKKVERRYREVVESFITPL